MSTQYIFKQSDFQNNKFDTTVIYDEILNSDITIALESVVKEIRGCVITFKAQLLADEEDILNNIISNHSGDSYIESEEKRDISGKLRVHQTSRPLGTTVHWTGEGDDISDISNVGGGQQMVFKHNIGDELVQYLYLSFNVIENRSFIHEGLFSWHDCQGDYLSVEVVPYVATYETSSNTNYTLYNNFLVIPATGDGNINITSDLSQPNMGLVCIPDGDQGEPPNGFWDADWDIENKQFVNIRPNIEQKGQYNIFTQEIPLVRLLNHVPLLGSGFQMLNSSDTDEIGQGMRLRLGFETNTTIAPDHEWSATCTLVMHRVKTV